MKNLAGHQKGSRQTLIGGAMLRAKPDGQFNSLNEALMTLGNRPAHAPKNKTIKLCFFTILASCIFHLLSRGDLSPVS